MERFDYYDILPKGMDAYLSSHGHHFSKSMYLWAVSMMEDRSGEKAKPIEKSKLDELFIAYGMELKRKKGYYDAPYVYCMAKSDYFGSSLPDERKVLQYIVDYIDDVDGNPTRAFDEFYINCMAKGVDIPWEDLI